MHDGIYSSVRFRRKRRTRWKRRTDDARPVVGVLALGDSRMGCCATAALAHFSGYVDVDKLSRTATSSRLRAPLEARLREGPHQEGVLRSLVKPGE